MNTTNSVEVSKSRILEGMETLLQVGVSQASTESYYEEEEDNCRADPKLASSRMGAVGNVFELPPAYGKSGCRVVCVNGIRCGSPNENPMYQKGGGGD